jgi:hypothetical protein
MNIEQQFNLPGKAGFEQTGTSRLGPQGTNSYFLEYTAYVVLFGDMISMNY